MPEILEVACVKNKDAAPTTERLGERLLDTDSRVNFLGRGQREDIPDTE